MKVINCKYKVITKRDGSEEEFNSIKIVNSIYSAMRKVQKKPLRKVCKELATNVVLKINERKSEKIDVESVQDMVETILVSFGNTDIAKEYILYRKDRENQRKSLRLDPVSIVKSYIDASDWRVNENANSSYSFPSLVNHISGSVLSAYALNNLYPRYIAEAHISGDIHIHDMSEGGVIAYCAGWSLRDLLEKGFVGLKGRATASPAKHLDTALLQMVNFLMSLQCEHSGAQAFNSVDTFLAPFIRFDKLNYKQVKQALQQAIYGLNVPQRLGQSAFTNFSFDLVVPRDLKETPVIVGGEYLLDYCYGDFQEEMNMLNKAFLEIMYEGDASGAIFSFPIPTYNITDDFNWDSEVSDLLFDITAKYGIPYFQNFVNSELDPQDVRSMCCRLSINIAELQKKTGGVFGAGDLTGSIGVCTINLPRIGYLAKDEPEFFKKLGLYMDIAKDSLEIKRDYVEQNLARGLMPYSAVYLKNYNSHFSTIGLVGANEACLNFLGKDISTKEGIEFSIKVLNFMRTRLEEYQESTGTLWNLEASPAEGTSYSLALKDKKLYGSEIKQAGSADSYYTNSTQLPVGSTSNVYQALDLQEELQCMYTGGSVFHAFIGEKITRDQAKFMVKNIVHKYRIPYLSITPTFSICPDHGYIAGEHHTCPECSK